MAHVKFVHAQKQCDAISLNWILQPGIHTEHQKLQILTHVKSQDVRLEAEKCCCRAPGRIDLRWKHLGQIGH